MNRPTVVLAVTMSVQEKVGKQQNNKKIVFVLYVDHPTEESSAGAAVSPGTLNN